MVVYTTNNENLFVAYSTKLNSRRAESGSVVSDVPTDAYRVLCNACGA